jgi:hypothetical protein
VLKERLRKWAREQRRCDREPPRMPLVLRRGTANRRREMGSGNKKIRKT